MAVDIPTSIQQRIHLYNALEGDLKFKQQVIEAHDLMRQTISSGGKILIFGNGGSAAEAQHFAAELVCQFEKKRRALPVIALTTDTSILTAQSNDIGFETVFSRQIEALSKKEDLVIGLTTSDVESDYRHSTNILNGFLEAKVKGTSSIGLFSQKTVNLLRFVDVGVVIPSKDTAIIQEGHLFIIHLLCGLIEDSLF